MKNSEKKEVCLANEDKAYSSELIGFVVKDIQYGIEDYLFAEYRLPSGAVGSYHKLRIRYDKERPYVRFGGMNLHLDCMERVF